MLGKSVTWDVVSRIRGSVEYNSTGLNAHNDVWLRVRDNVIEDGAMYVVINSIYESIKERDDAR